mmetsp:Transcript_873/g.1250  ORF Transcript_873/g.1250 Transcript_873/m.1250 type:complete len:80 (+) Transcript_873:512-751(+)
MKGCILFSLANAWTSVAKGSSSRLRHPKNKYIGLCTLLTQKDRKGAMPVPVAIRRTGALASLGKWQSVVEKIASTTSSA